MDLHKRYLLQATWTRELRSYVLGRSGWATSRSALEVGCGTGALLANLPGSDVEMHGIDIDRHSLLEARTHAPKVHLACGNALALPYEAAAFDITFCHFLLLWIPEPLQALREMKRVTARSGYVIAFAEPDYSAREDRPAGLRDLGQKQNEALERKGAALSRGAELAGLFDLAGISILETGTIQPPASTALGEDQWESEWQVLADDLAGAVSAAELERLQRRDRAAMLAGRRVLHVPTYFAWGQV